VLIIVFGYGITLEKSSGISRNAEIDEISLGFGGYKFNINKGE
jgi:hypothetical protein